MPKLLHGVLRIIGAHPCVRPVSGGHQGSPQHTNKHYARVLLVVALTTFAGFVFGQSQRNGSLSTDTRNSSSAYSRAFKLLESGKAAEALSEIDAALAKDASDLGLYNLRGLAAGQLGKESEAEASFRKVIQLSPGAAMGYNNLAVLLTQSGREAEAAELFRTAIERDPHNFTALLGLGATLSASQKYAEAEPYLQKAWIARPGDFRAGFEYAHALRELKRPAEARKTLGRLTPPGDPAVAAKFFTLSGVVAEDLTDWAAAIRAYGEAHKLARGSFEIYVSLIRASLRSGAGQQARTLPAAPPDLSAEQHFVLGVLLASRDADAEAVPHFEATLRTEPESYSAAYNLALAYKGAGKAQAAMGLIEHWLEKKPTAELYNLLASLEESTGRYVEAVRDYRRAVDLEPTNEQYYTDLGLEYLSHFTFGPALEVFRVGSQKFPASLRQQVGLGLAHYALRHYPEAADAFLRAVEIDPSSPSAFAAWNTLPSFVALTEWEGILPRLRRLAEAHPKSAEALYCYGATLFAHDLAAGKPENLVLAQSLLEQAMRLKPGFTDAHLELGNLYAAQKENEKAVVEFLEAIRLDPHSEMAHYRLGQIYRDSNRLELAQRELAVYAELSRNRLEKMARSRSAIKQFILTESSSSSSSLAAQRQSPPADPR